VITKSALKVGSTTDTAYKGKGTGENDQAADGGGNPLSYRAKQKMAAAIRVAIRMTTGIITVMMDKIRRAVGER